MPALFSVLFASLSKYLGDSLLRWAAFKILMFALFTVVLPVVLMKVWFLIQTYFLGFVLSFIDTSAFEGVGFVELTGVGAHIGGLLQLPRVMSILVGAGLTHFTLSFIRK